MSTELTRYDVTLPTELRLTIYDDWNTPALRCAEVCRIRARSAARH